MFIPLKLTTKKMKRIQKFREVIQEIEYQQFKSGIKNNKIEFKNQMLLADDIEQQLELTFETNMDLNLLKSLFNIKKYTFEEIN